MQKFDNENTLEQFINHMKLQIFNKEFAELCTVSQETIGEILKRENEDLQKTTSPKKSKSKSPKTQEERRKINNPKSLLNKRKSPETEIEQEVLPQSNFKLIKQDQNQLTLSY